MVIKNNQHDLSYCFLNNPIINAHPIYHMYNWVVNINNMYQSLYEIMWISSNCMHSMYLNIVRIKRLEYASHDINYKWVWWRESLLCTTWVHEIIYEGHVPALSDPLTCAPNYKTSFYHAPPPPNQVIKQGFVTFEHFLHIL